MHGACQENSNDSASAIPLMPHEGRAGKPAAMMPTTKILIASSRRGSVPFFRHICSRVHKTVPAGRRATDVCVFASRTNKLH